MLGRLKPVVQRGFGIARHTAGRGERVGRRVASDAFGLMQRARNFPPSAKAGMDDKTLKNKVETELFRAADAPKGKVNVNVVDGIVYLRGEVKQPKDVRWLETRTKAIPEVRGVENLLHLPKTPAPTRTDSPRSQQKQTTKQSPRRATRTTRRRTTADKTTATPGAEPTPDELAAKREGRKPAKLGSDPGS